MPTEELHRIRKKADETVQDLSYSRRMAVSIDEELFESAQNILRWVNSEINYNRE